MFPHVLRPCRALRTRAFTLIELLVVIGIISIMLALLAPAISGLGRSAELTNGGNMVANLVALARQTAISKNTLSALVLLGKQGTTEDYRALAVYEYDAGQGWNPVGKWELLSDSVIVDFTDTTNCTFMVNSPNPFPFLTGPPAQQNPPCFYQGKQLDSSAYAARIFLPQGGLMNSQNPAQIRIVEGFASGSQITRTRRNGAASANYYDVFIIGATGSVKIGRP